MKKLIVFLSLFSICNSFGMDEQPPAYDDLPGPSVRMNRHTPSQAEETQSSARSLSAFISEMEYQLRSYGTFDQLPYNQEISSLPASLRTGLRAPASHESLVFDANDEEYSRLFAQAGNNTQGFLDIIRYAHTGETEAVNINLKKAGNIRVGALPLRAAVIGGQLATVTDEEFLSRFSSNDAKKAFFDASRSNKATIAQSLIKKFGLKFYNDDIATALELSDIEAPFLDMLIPLKADSPLRKGFATAVVACRPKAVDYFIKNGARISVSDELLDATSLSIKEKLLVLKKQEEEREKERTLLYNQQLNTSKPSMDCDTCREDSAEALACLCTVFCCYDGCDNVHTTY